MSQCKRLKPFKTTPWPKIRGGTIDNLPAFKACVFLQEMIKIAHKLVDRLAHVHMSDLGPNCVCIGEDCGFSFKRAEGGLELVAVNEKQN